MRKEEALKIKEIKEKFYKKNKIFKNIINLGSSNIQELAVKKPWSQTIFELYKNTSSKVIHVDSQKYPGVNIVQDLSLPNSFEVFKKLKGSKLFILTNVLEHIPKKAHVELFKKIEKAMSKGDGLIVSAPYDYPYHPDPIDNLYRPHPVELEKLIALKWQASDIVISGSFMGEFKHMSFHKKIRKLLKIFWPFQPLKRWLECHRLIYLFRTYKISIVFGIK